MKKNKLEFDRSKKFITKFIFVKSYVIHTSVHKDYKTFYNWWHKQKFNLRDEFTDFPRHYIKFRTKKDENQMIKKFKENIAL